MAEENKKFTPKVNSGNNCLLTPTILIGGLRKKEKGTKSHVEFLKMIEKNKDPLARQGRPFHNYTLEEVSRHNTEDDAWIILNNKVYDITMYINCHPGGRILLNAAGADGTSLFMRYHPWISIESIIGKLQIGTISQTTNFLII